MSGCTSQEYPWAKSQGPCNLSEEQKVKAWENVISAMKTEQPKHSEYCDLNRPQHDLTFERVEGKCRTYLGCGNSVNGGYLLHGDVFVYINESTQEVTGIYDVAW